jgi:hypothetical protein
LDGVSLICRSFCGVVASSGSEKVEKALWVGKNAVILQQKQKNNK